MRLSIFFSSVSVHSTIPNVYRRVGSAKEVREVVRWRVWSLVLRREVTRLQNSSFAFSLTLTVSMVAPSSNPRYLYRSMSVSAVSYTHLTLPTNREV